MAGYVRLGRSTCPCCGSDRIDTVRRECLACKIGLPMGSLDVPIIGKSKRGPGRRYATSRRLHQDSLSDRRTGNRP